MTNNLNQNRDIFLSHRTVDKDFIRKLAADVEASYFENRRLSTWVDEAEIRGGESIPGKINWGIENSRYIGIVMTPDYFNSPSGWTDAEWHSVLHLDPDNRNGRILPILAKDCPYIPVLLRHLKLFDLRDKQYKQGLRELLAALLNEPLRRPSIYRGQLITSNGRIDRQTYLAERSVIGGDPDVTKENLFCNLLPIIGLPHYIYTAPISTAHCSTTNEGQLSLPSKQKLKDLIRQNQLQMGIEKPYVPAFRVFEYRIVTFYDLEAADGPFTSIIDDNEIVTTFTADWIQDEDDRKILISLLNMTVSRHAIYRGLIADDAKNYRFYFSIGENGSVNEIEWRPTKTKKVPRTVAKPCTSTDGKVLFWRHHAAYLKVLFLSNKFYLQIIPTLVLTDDGYNMRSGSRVGSVVNRWLGRERNQHILYHVRFWSVILQGKAGPISMRAGDQYLEVAPIPSYVAENFGILGDQMKLMDRLNDEAELIDYEIEDAVDTAIERGLNEDEGEIESEEDIIEVAEDGADNGQDAKE
jgi:hypothetical protein